LKIDVQTVRVIAVRAKDDPSALAALIQALHDPDEEIRHGAVVFLTSHDYIRRYLESAKAGK
jgi:hypothetical protein